MSITLTTAIFQNYNPGVISGCNRLNFEIIKTELGDPSELGGGDRHPDTASSLNNLAGLYSNTDRLAEAIAPMTEALSILEAVLGRGDRSG